MLDYALLGLLVIAAGVVVLFIAMLSSGRGSGERQSTKGAVVLMIGPIPVIFGNDSRMIIVAIVLAIVLILVALLAGFL